LNYFSPEFFRRGGSFRRLRDTLDFNRGFAHREKSSNRLNLVSNLSFRYSGLVSEI
jgi:hypothetical protein